VNTEGVIDFQISLEERISRVYREIADQSPEDTEWAALWRELSADEGKHASLLAIEKMFLQNGTRFKRPIEIDPEVEKALNGLLSNCERRVRSGMTQKDAVEILAALEASEVNKLFSTILKATDSKVLSRLADSSRAHLEHDRHIQAAMERYGGSEHPVTAEMNGQDE